MSQNSNKNIYTRRSSWRIWLTIAGACIVIITLAFTYSISVQLKAIVENNMNLYALAYKELNEDAEDLDKDVELPMQLIEMNKSIRMLVVDANDNILWNINFPSAYSEDEKYLNRKLKQIKKSKFEPIDITLHGQGQRIYYAPPIQYTLLTYLPIVVLLLLTSYIGIGYMGFNNSRKAEQNKVWVGMARETAHQLGTPISAILAWIENLRITDLSEEQNLYIEELEKDVNKLDMVADRFSKIGSKPVLETLNLANEIEEAMSYMRARAPKKIEFTLQVPPDINPIADINRHLFTWVIENILRNAIDAMDGAGQISIELSEQDDQHLIQIKDTGKGISPKDLKNIFHPGFTTKKRGWGLGLSLAKRIIETYHNGKIYIITTTTGKGTSFGIELPKSKNTE